MHLRRGLGAILIATVFCLPTMRTEASLLQCTYQHTAQQLSRAIQRLAEVSGEAERALHDEIVALAYQLPRERRIGIAEIDTYFEDMAVAKGQKDEARIQSIQRALSAEFSDFLTCPAKAAGRFNWGSMLLRQGAL